MYGRKQRRELVCHRRHHSPPAATAPPLNPPIANISREPGTMSGPQHRAKHADKGERSWAVPRQGTGLGPLAVILPIASSAAAAIFAWRTSQVGERWVLVVALQSVG